MATIHNVRVSEPELRLTVGNHIPPEGDVWVVEDEFGAKVGRIISKVNSRPTKYYAMSGLMVSGPFKSRQEAWEDLRSWLQVEQSAGIVTNGCPSPPMGYRQETRFCVESQSSGQQLTLPF